MHGALAGWLNGWLTDRRDGWRTVWLMSEWRCVSIYVLTIYDCLFAFLAEWLI